MEKMEHGGGNLGRSEIGVMTSAKILYHKSFQWGSMISHTRECERLRPGLSWHINWQWKRFWFRLIWCRYDYMKMDAWYFRFKVFDKPFVFDRWTDTDPIGDYLS